METTPIEVFVAESMVYQKLTALRVLFGIQLETYFDEWRLCLFDKVSAGPRGEWREADLLTLVNRVHKEALSEYRKE